MHTIWHYVLSGRCPAPCSHDLGGDGMKKVVRKTRTMIMHWILFFEHGTTTASTTLYVKSTLLHLHYYHSLCLVDTVHHLPLGLGHDDLGDDGMNMEWKIITCIVALINGLQIEKVCPTFVNFAKNNHNHRNVAKFGTVWSQSFIVRWDFEQVAVSRVPQLTCIWMSLPAGNGLGNLTSRGFSVALFDTFWKFIFSLNLA